MKPVNHLKRWEDHERQTLIEDVIIGRSWEAVAKSAKRTVAAVVSEYYRIASNPQSDFERHLSNLVEVNHHSYPESREARDEVERDESIPHELLGAKFIYPKGAKSWIYLRIVDAVFITDTGRTFVYCAERDGYYDTEECEFIINEFVNS